jgi:excisionase family DNA binding protein
MSTKSKRRPPPGFITVDEVASHIGITAQTVRRMIERSELPASHVGGRYLIPESAVATLLSPKERAQPLHATTGVGS